MDKYLAHIRKNSQGQAIAEQTAAEHCRKAAEYAAEALKPVGLSKCGYLAGLVHDAGKFNRRFQDYLVDENAVRGSVNHTFAGVRIFLDRYWRGDGEFRDIASEILAFSAGSHHGLFDCVDENQKNGFQYRLSKEGIGYSEARNNFYKFCVTEKELDQRFQSALKEMTEVLEQILDMTGDDADDQRYDEETAFYCSLLTRLILSAVIEGDRRDTAEFMNGEQFPERLDDKALKRLWRSHLDLVEDKLKELPCKTPIDRARQEISNRCKEQALKGSGGVFRLNVPTGGGKTLSSLRFALAHAENNGKQRIIFTLPLLSILEQNAEVIRNYIQDDRLILEHHSNLMRTEDNGSCLDKRELLTENWEAPVIITTLVQLLNTLFCGKTTAIRRFHALCGSIIVIDEVQSVPSKMLSLFSLAVNFLSEICNATVILCSATQPGIDNIKHPIHKPVPDLVPYDARLWEVFKRTEIQDGGTMTLSQVADLARDQLKTFDSVLVICNKKNEAQDLYRSLKNEGFATFSLSAAMCPAHRSQTLDQLRKSLKINKQKTVCVATQVIEAGVDISFASVIRLTAGMDNIVQAAGRCNRSGELGEGIVAPVYAVQLQNESLSHLPDIQRGQEATRHLFTAFLRDKDRFDGQLDSISAVKFYYKALYRLMPECSQDYVWRQGQPSLFSLLSTNINWVENDEVLYNLNQAFRKAGRVFEVFEDKTVDVIVPYEAGKELIEELGDEQLSSDPVRLRKLLNRAKLYSVSLYQYQIDHLEKEGSLLRLQDGVLGLQGYYSVETGFSMEEK